jgi:[acyl-carrier-protein] S-malonyltransferase
VLCARAAGADTLEAANFNTPTQTIVSGDEAAVRRLLEMVDGRPMMQAMRLPAGAGFHSALMQPVEDELAAVIARLTWRDPDVPVASNAFGTLVHSGPGVRDSLLAQVTSPVRWVDCIRALLDAGCEHFLELGPGRILRGLTRQIARKVDVAAADSRAGIEAFAAARPNLVRS